MKKLIVLAFASSVVMGLATTAQAEFTGVDVYASRDAVRLPIDEARFERERCIGLSAGTAHHSCGTRTGGPAGGLH